MTKLTNTFTAVLTAFGLIVPSSFVFNFYNVKKGSKMTDLLYCRFYCEILLQLIKIR